MIRNTHMENTRDMTFCGRINSKGHFIPFKEVFTDTPAEKQLSKIFATPSDGHAKGGTMMEAQRPSHTYGCTFPLSPESHRCETEKGSPTESFHKDPRLSIRIRKSPSSKKKRMIKGSLAIHKSLSPPSPGSAQLSIKRSPVRTSSKRLNKGKSIKRSPAPTSTGNAAKNIKQSLNNPKPPDTSSAGNIRKKQVKKSASSAAPKKGKSRKDMKQTPKTDKSYVVMVGNKQMQITQSLDMRKSALLTFADSRKKRSPKLQKSASSQSPKRALGGNNRMTSKPSLELHKSASLAATDATPNKDSRMAMKRSSKMLKSSSSRGKNRMNKKQSLELQKSPALLSPEECPKQKRLSSPASLSPHAITKKYSRMNKSEFQQSPRTASSAENFQGSQEEFSPISSPDMNYNSDIRLSLSPLYSAAPGDESPGSPGIYRMTRQRSSEFHISPYTSSPESCISNKKRSIYDSTSDERRSRKKLLNLMNESYLRSASSSQPEDKDTFDFDTPTNSQKGTPQPTKTQKQNCKAKAWNWTFDDWFAYKKKERQMEQQRKEQERASRDFMKARRKEISQGVYQMWLRNKQRELEAKRIQDHMQLAALTAQSSLKKNPIKVPVRNIPQDTINQELECWRLKKIEIQRAKRREQQLEALKHEEEIFNRQQKSEMALKKWFSTVHTKPKPVPMNQGVDSLRGTISKLYVNPQPWVAC